MRKVQKANWEHLKNIYFFRTNENYFFWELRKLLRKSEENYGKRKKVMRNIRENYEEKFGWL